MLRAISLITRHPTVRGLTFDSLRPRSNPNQSFFLHKPSKTRIFTQESITWNHSLGTLFLCDADNCFAICVCGYRTGIREQHGFASEKDVQGCCVGFRVDCDGADVEAVSGCDDANGDLVVSEVKSVGDTNRRELLSMGCHRLRVLGCLLTSPRLAIRIVLIACIVPRAHVDATVVASGK